MWLGERPARGGAGDGGELTWWGVWLLAGCCALVTGHGAAAATVGPARIVCNAAFCELGSGAKPKERFRVIVSDLPKDEVQRLRKCTGVAKPCIVTIDGAEQGSAMRILAVTIRWQD